ncbi:MAG: bacteriohemerythrin [Proteobacteria bacterium]|nr:bacteriohemerythrin [Pseudomonadota bacterium]
MEKIKWDKSISVNIMDVDENLKKIIDLINKIIDLKQSKNCDENELMETFADLTEFVRNYFPHEENYLIKYKYPELKQHKKEHKKFVKKINAFRRWFAEDPANLSDDVVRYLREWVLFHIQEFDMTFGPFIRVQLYLDECSPKKVARY